ncbi:hypothetical protein CBR_g30119 [Chara braunii]|uniref:Uncharacterized protein n=1 Tax=Chara braunii TaxID=69332 RepID=A0A388LC40_CHABU|nr:hypothetical protein CBR_g30119 [Chara braunii]|eukprot:GBG79854.1 hypothetical protein CBR_g30119 [Chara braunii]
MRHQRLFACLDEIVTRVHATTKIQRRGNTDRSHVPTVPMNRDSISQPKQETQWIHQKNLIFSSFIASCPQ